MASYKNNFIIVLLIVFYSFMNFNNVYCPTIDEIKQCKYNMTLYCGDYLGSALSCAKVAILMYFPIQHPSDTYRYFVDNSGPARPASFESIPIPKCVSQYFDDHVNLFISNSEVQSTKDFCNRRDIHGDNDVLTEFTPYLFEGRSASSVLQAIINICKKSTAFLDEHTLQGLFFKDSTSMSKLYDDSITISKFAIKYLQDVANKITLIETGTRKPETPEQFCQHFENN